MSMPYIGLYSFLPSEVTNSNTNTDGCQCPTSGFTHFYEFRVDRAWTAAVCQCPTSGFTHFYKVPGNEEVVKKEGCQCPTSGFTHFYGPPSKPTFFRYVPTPNLHMFLNQVDFFSFFRPILGFLEIFTKSFSTVYLYYTQLSNLMQEKFFPPITFELYHHYTNCNQNT